MLNDNKNMYQEGAKVGLEPTFFGKVMSFFALAILSSAAGTFITYKYFLLYFIQHPALMYVLFALELVLIFTSRIWSTKRPLNRVMFAAFTFITGVTVAPLIGVLMASSAGVAILSKALLATALMFSATAIFGWTTKWNLSGLRGFLLIGLIGLIIVGVIGIFIPWSNATEMVYAGFGVLLFSGFTMYDFQKLKQYPEDRYIDAALNLYLDLFNLFLMILRLIMGSSRD